MSCVVRHCRSTWKPKCGIKFHSFPKDPERRRHWLSIMPLKRQFYESAKICSLHFKAEDYDPDKPDCLINSASPFYMVQDCGCEATKSCILLDQTNKNPDVNTVKVEADYGQDSKENEIKEETPESMDVYQCKTEPIEHAFEGEENLPVLIKVESIASSSPTPMKMQQIETATSNQAFDEEDDIDYLEVDSTASTSPTPTQMEESETTTSNNASDGEDDIVYVNTNKIPDFSVQRWKRKWMKEKEVSQRRLKTLNALRSKNGRLIKKVESLEKILTDILQSKSHPV